MNKTKSTETDMVSFTDLIAMLTLIVSIVTLIVKIIKK